MKQFLSSVTLKVALLIFIVEIAIMLLLDKLAIAHSDFRDILDASLLVILICPTFYLLIVKPYIFAIQVARENASALKNKEEQLRYVLKGSELGFWDWNIISGEVQRNARWAEILGYSYEDIKNTTKQWTDFI